MTRFRLTRRNALCGSLAGAAVLVWPPVTFAQTALAIAVPEFVATPDERATARMMWETVTGDLTESGRLTLIDPARFAGIAADADKPPDFDAWRNAGAAALTTGRVIRMPDGRLSFEFPSGTWRRKCIWPAINTMPGWNRDGIWLTRRRKRCMSG